MRHAARRDLNDKAISDAIRRAGYTLVDYGKAGVGIPDKLALRLLPNGNYFSCWVEIKSKDGKLTKNQYLAKEVWEPKGEWLEGRDPETVVNRLNELYLMQSIRSEKIERRAN